jgi:hypothetical protein
MRHRDSIDAAPIDTEHRLLRAARARQLDEHYAKQLADAARETDSVMPERFASKLPGDERALRGIPAIGRGVTGAIPGTRPGDRP